MRDSREIMRNSREIKRDYREMETGVPGPAPGIGDIGGWLGPPDAREPLTHKINIY